MTVVPRGRRSVAAVRETSAAIVSRLSDERWLLLLLSFHVVGVHWLAGARAWWTRLPAALCLLATVAFWIKAIGLTPSMIGLNAPTGGALGGLVILAALWLFLCGKAPREWLTGFGVAVLGASLALVASGSRLAALACASLSIPLLGATFWFARWNVRSDAVGPPAERVVSMAAALVLAAVLCVALTERMRPTPTSLERSPRLRDFATQPAIALLLVVGASFGTAFAVRLWPTRADS